ncbi:MAG: sigma-54 dependent transcriptional regulator [Holophagales bacterium]|jgi:two-component system response regulator PilR (NtrC family)|nr:sigma-54 dependent transcriptional regulator [Holophagales bacterium]
MSTSHKRADDKQVLIVEDDEGFREVLSLGLGAEGIETFAVGSLREAKEALARQKFAAVVSDMRLGSESGLDLLSWIKEESLDIPSVIMTAYATAETTVQALSLGAVDFLTKAKNDIHELVKVVQGLMTKAAPFDMSEDDSSSDLVGSSDSIRRVQALIGKYAIADATVLITGESGTGKEIAARLIHRHSARAKGPFVAVNCAALPENLLESELFGYEKGSFTGASTAKRGLFEDAKGGVVFLDEIGEMPLPLQVKLLRVLQELKVRRIGSSRETPIDVRVICATNHNIRELADNGSFRQDLYYRLNILHLEMPPLRQRLEDLPALIGHFLAGACARHGKPSMSLTQDAMDALMSYSFPGNVRELENLMERFAALGSGGALDKDVFPDNILAELESKRHDNAESPATASHVRGHEAWIPSGGLDLDAYLKSTKGYFVQKALTLSGGNKTKAAHLLGMGYRPLKYLLEEAGGAEALPKEHPAPQDFPLPKSP